MTSPDQQVPERPQFDGVIRGFTMPDLPYLRRILEMWVKWEGKVLTEEVEEDLEHLRKSSRGEINEKYFVAEAPGGRVLGMMGLAVDPKPEVKQHAATERPMELVRAYVDEDFRGGRGVGRKLIGRIEHKAKLEGSTEVMLDSGPRYEKTGHGFYDKMGYKRVAVNKNYYGPGGDAIVFSKVLVSSSTRG